MSKRLSSPMTLATVAAILIAIFFAPASAQRFVEKLNRGVIAVKSGSGYLVSWRLFGTDPQGTTFGFNVYKGATKLNATVITNATCYQDNSSGSGTYTVKVVTNGVEGEVSENALIIDNGYVNIPLTLPAAGSTANDCSTGDLDGDGQYDVVLKWEPSNAKDNSQSGVTDNVFLDGYKLDGTRLWRIDLGPNIRAGAHYTQFLVFDFDGDGKAEVMCKTAPGTKDASGAYIKTGPAAAASHTTKYANTAGYILTGPEFFTVFAGPTGNELVTVDYNPPRGNDIDAIWGDDYGNRVDRFNSVVAYLDGERPSAVFERGYYTRTTQWAIDWRGGKLTQRWFFDGNNSSGYNGQGNHGIMSGDVDQDGKDEIVNGSMCVDHDGKALWTARLGHGDAAHLTDIDPSRPGLEVWGIHENAQVGSALLDAKTGAVIWSTGPGDVGRGVAADLVASSKGLECWGGTADLRTCTDQSAGANPSSSNFLCWWDGDLLRELENGTSVSKYGGSTLLNGTGCASNNGTKSTPCLVADILGDWREEVIWRTSGNDALRIYVTNVPTTNRLFTLMHDPQYRCQVSMQQSAYNQPSQTGFYLGEGMTLPQTKPNVAYYGSTGARSGMSTPDRSRLTANASRMFRGNGAVALPSDLRGAPTMLEVYDCAGKLVKRAVVNKGDVNLQDELGLTNAMYVVRIAVPRATRK